MPRADELPILGLMMLDVMRAQPLHPMTVQELANATREPLKSVVATVKALEGAKLIEECGHRNGENIWRLRRRF